MLIPSAALTPMERALLLQLQSLETHQIARAERQDRRIDALEAEIRARDRAISDLSRALARLLGPLAPDASSPS
ncbi:hypothetical protein ACFSDD_24105 [Salipiger marinus]|uniref:Uncharacterized protein n=1 Tax=Salipiger marinus TaxID=555512 RepID=A0A1G8TEH3_9RHOB|nr:MULTISPECIES: hypothetical protein [Salipiger]MCD1619298.1 hypothetical protein [Salipiger manganoxidans]MEB3421592.1 hypothetical protein [Salipiger manganoxidans]SDJ39908.1 hypothetical protein SAMN04487993_102944 [Salipiger marinus]